MIWLIGNKGMLGHDVEKLLTAGELPFVASDLDVDITDYRALEAFPASHNLSGLDWIVNCAAYTAVDKAEEEADTAFRINKQGPANLALLAKKYAAALIHISTDYVFDGNKQDAYGEEDATCPLGVYGKSKLEGEESVVGTWHKHYILRTAWLYGKNGKNFVFTMLNLMKTREEIRVVADQWGSPTYVKDLAAALVAIIEKERQSSAKHYGIYNYTNEGKTNWFEFTRKISAFALKHALLGKEIRITPITTDQYPVKARRPAHSELSKAKIAGTFGLQPRLWETALEDFMANEVKQ